MPTPQEYAMLASMMAGGPQEGASGDPSSATPITVPDIAPPTSGAASPVPDTSAADQFEQDVMQRLRDNTPENIEKKKMAEYLRNLGIANKPNSVKSRLIRAGDEAGRYYSAQQSKTHYLPMNQQIQKESQAEYEKSYPLIRAEAESVFKNQRERNKEASAANVQGLKNIPLMARVMMQKELGDQKNAIERDVALHENGNRDATARLKNSQAKLLELGLQQYPELVGLPKDQQSLLAPLIITNALGPELSGRYFRAIQEQKAAAQKPDDKASYIGQLPDEEKTNVMDTYREMQKIKGENKPALVPSFRPLQQEVWNPVTQQLEQKTNLYNPKDPYAPTVPVGGRPVNPKAVAQNDEWNSAVGNARTFASNVASAIKDGTINSYVGPVEGNPLIRSMRAMGWEGDVGRSPREAIINAFRSNTLFKHTRALMASGRMPMQALDHVAENVSKMNDKDDSIIAGALSILHSAEQGRMNNGDPSTINKSTPELAGFVGKRLEGYIKNLHVPGMPLGNLPSLPDLMKEYETAIPSSTSKQKTRLELYQEKYGVGAK